MTATRATAFNDGDGGSGIVVATGICRVCLEECPTRELISPCSCRGTLAHVHRDCFSDMVSAMMREKCDICGTHYERQSPRLRPWRKWKWSLPHDSFYVVVIFFSSLQNLHCLNLIRGSVYIDPSPSAFKTCVLWIDCLARWLWYILIAITVLYSVYMTAKQWIRDNTVYDWKDGGKQ